MSKKSRRDQRRKAQLRAGNTEAPAPPPIPKSPILTTQRGARLDVQNQRQVWLTHAELKDLIVLVESVTTQYRLLPYLKQVLSQFTDAVLHLREAEAAAIAIGFWLEDKGTVNKTLTKIRAGRKKAHRNAEAAMAAPSVGVKNPP